MSIKSIINHVADAVKNAYDAIKENRNSILAAGITGAVVAGTPAAVGCAVLEPQENVDISQAEEAIREVHPDAQNIELINDDPHADISFVVNGRRCTMDTTSFTVTVDRAHGTESKETRVVPADQSSIECGL